MNYKPVPVKGYNTIGHIINNHFKLVFFIRKLKKHVSELAFHVVECPGQLAYLIVGLDFKNLAEITDVMFSAL